MAVYKMQTLRGFPSQHALHPLVTGAQSWPEAACSCLLRTCCYTQILSRVTCHFFLFTEG